MRPVEGCHPDYALCHCARPRSSLEKWLNHSLSRSVAEGLPVERGCWRSAMSMSLSRIERSWVSEIWDAIFPRGAGTRLRVGVRDLDVEGFLDDLERSMPF